ncbi:MAG: PGF-pre-PGF domain-containing protein [Candidatus Nanoarchaeia archaeon]
MDRTIIFGLALIASIALLMPVANATITLVQIVNSTGNAMNLSHDDQTQSYADGSIENQNAFVKICSTNPNSDLVGKYVGLFYREGGISQPVHILPALVSSTNIINNCAIIDLDLGFLAARYPAIPAIGISSSPTMASPTYYFPWLDGSGGMLAGNFTFVYNEVNATTINFTIKNALDENLSPIGINKRFILVSLRRSNGIADSAAQLGINEPVLLSWSNKPGYYFSINGIPFGSPVCKDGEVLCSDRVCRPADKCVPLYCSNGTANGVCEYGEGCGCPDCDRQQDSCEQGLICISGACGKEVKPSGGVSAPFKCIWNNTYDGGLIANEPVKLFFFQECTLLREVSIVLNETVKQANIVVFGNNSIIEPPPPNPPSGTVIDYFKFQHNIPDDKFSKVVIQFKIPKMKLKANGFSVGDITLRKFTIDGWKVFPATFVSEDNEFYYFESKTDTLSLFVVVGEKAAMPIVTPTPLPIIAPPAPSKAVSAIPVVPLAISTLAIITILVLAYRYYIRRKPKRFEVKIKARAPEQPPLKATELQLRLAQIQKEVAEMESRLKGKR